MIDVLLINTLAVILTTLLENKRLPECTKCSKFFKHFIYWYLANVQVHSTRESSRLIYFPFIRGSSQLISETTDIQWYISWKKFSQTLYLCDRSMYLLLPYYIWYHLSVAFKLEGQGWKGYTNHLDELLLKFQSLLSDTGFALPSKKDFMNW